MLETVFYFPTIDDEYIDESITIQPLSVLAEVCMELMALVVWKDSRAVVMGEGDHRIFPPLRFRIFEEWLEAYDESAIEQLLLLEFLFRLQRRRLRRTLYDLPAPLPGIGKLDLLLVRIVGEDFVEFLLAVIEDPGGWIECDLKTYIAHNLYNHIHSLLTP